jgi:glutamate/tyrosine decarboxylase-like PLP-dependent enzyme
MFVPGGSMANIYGMHSARGAKLGTGVKKAGMIAAAQGRELVGFCSADSHYSYAKGASLMGLGSDNMVPIPVDHSPAGRGGMRLDLLEAAIQHAVAQGKVPFMVGATVGTTVYGGFDDVRGLREVCDRHQLWLHADGAWGGAVVFGAAGGKARSLSDGLGLADSVSWNPHKMMGAPLQCSVFLTRMVGEAGLRDINGCGASYCFQVDKNFPEEDMGDMTLLCSRRADSFKLWLLWRAVGDKGMADRVDTAVSLSQRFSEMIRDRAWLDTKGVKGRFVLWRDQDPFFSNICFYYLPPSMSDVEDGLAIWGLPSDDAIAKRVSRVAPFIKDGLQRKGTGGMMGFCGAHNHFRLVFASPIGLTHLDLESLVLAIDLVGATYQESPAIN